MRFVDDGPSIPDDLLVARDEGRVVFVCGAGVSRARANLPDFTQLTRRVIEMLGVTPHDPARRLLDAAEEFDRLTGTAGIISADRIFGLLERDFSVRDIEQAVATALKPVEKPDLSAHRIMLNLARLPDGRERIVTTNFDLLFEACDQGLPCYHPPRLPNPLRDDEFEGIIHLHGCVDCKYQNAEGEGFVLSSAGFGRAYLAEGWATSFIRSIIDQYIVVFVGYAADDPPVHYLLEALNSYQKSLAGVYAFQAGSTGDDEAEWKQKGAYPIAYDEADNHRALWDTLKSWAERARDPNAWLGNIISMARKGPDALLPHERGQVAHIVSTTEGAKKFANAEEPPPAEWLCVFDPSIRYMTPGSLNYYSESIEYFDPFYDAYSLDSDAPPPKIDPTDQFAKRSVPSGMWDAFALNKSDIMNIQNDRFATLRGHWAINVPRLPSRLESMSVWISRICHQPAAAWWAAGQHSIHSSLQNLIRSQILEHDVVHTCSSEVYKAWRFILEAWRAQKRDEDRDWYQLKSSIDRNGWTNDTIKELALFRRPYLVIDNNRPRWNGPKPPTSNADIRCDKMVSVSVKYPTPYDDAVIPDQFLFEAVREFRNNLEYAVFLEKKIGGYRLYHLPSIEPDRHSMGDSYKRAHGISSSLFYYVNLFKRLIEKDPQSAKQEYMSWRDEETVFDLLRIWSVGELLIFNGKAAGELLMQLSMQSFWNRYHQRDLLLVLKKRWNDFPKTIRKRLEQRLLRGPSPWESEKKAEYISRRAWTILNWLHWLADHGCRFSFDLSKKSEKLRKQAPDWEPKSSTKAADSMEGRGGWIKKEIGYADLLTEPPEALIQKAKELSETDFSRLRENDPFAGLSAERPELALAALVSNAVRDDYPEWAWRTFLYAEARKKDSVDFSVQIGNNIIEMTDDIICGIISPVSEWLLNASKTLLTTQPERFWRIWERLIPAIKSNPLSASSNIVRRKNEPDFATEGLNAPVGKLAQALLNDPAIDNLGKKKRLPLFWKKRVEELLHLEGDLHRHALVMFIHSLTWFYDKDTRWTRMNLISFLNSDNDDQKAFWSGFFWNPRTTYGLFKVLKPQIVRLISDKTIEKHGHKHALTGILLVYWWNAHPKTGERLISNIEMRDILLKADDNFRVQILWQINNLLTGKKEDLSNLKIFLTEVWPRHKKAKSSRVSAALCELAFTDAQTFENLANIILPLVSKIDNQGLFIYTLNKSNIVDTLPGEVLALLFAVLPDHVSEWPHGTVETLNRIGTANSTLLKDRRMIELRKRLGAV